MVGNRVVAPDGAILMEESYTRNRLGDITRRDTERGTFLYGYDALRQLSSADYPYPDLPDDAFTYDPMGNRLSDAAGTSYAYNALNQLTSLTPAGGPTALFAFDAAGNMTRDGSTTPPASLSWDESNRLTAYDRPAAGANPAIHAEYAYAPDARRLCKSVDGVTTYFLYTDEGLRAEYDAEGHPIRSYTYRPNSLWMTQPLLLHARPLGAPPAEPLTAHLYLVDHLHASEKLTTLPGILAWQAQESAFGAATPAPTATAENPLRLSSQYYDAESGHHYNYHRHHSPATGRYISADQTGLEGGYNLYRFAKNRPSFVLDPLGLQGLEPASASGFSSGPWGDRPECCDKEKIKERINRIADLASGGEGAPGGITMRGAYYNRETNRIEFVPEHFPSSFIKPESLGNNCLDFCASVHEWFHFTDNQGWPCSSSTTHRNLMVRGGCWDYVAENREFNAYKEEMRCLKSLLQE